MPELTFYVDVAANEAAKAEEILQETNGLPGIVKADVRTEELERSLCGGPMS